jgi:hypothetical protein
MREHNYCNERVLYLGERNPQYLGSIKIVFLSYL